MFEQAKILSLQFTKLLCHVKFKSIFRIKIFSVHGHGPEEK